VGQAVENATFVHSRTRITVSGHKKATDLNRWLGKRLRGFFLERGAHRAVGEFSFEDSEPGGRCGAG
jgi:hypothetical protein